MDISNPVSILTYIQGLSYFFLFLLFVWEGPVVNYVSAFAASLGVFNVFIIFILAVLGNIVGDLIYYFIGKLGKKTVMDKYLRKTLKPEKIAKIEGFLRNNPGKTIFVIKITPWLPTPGFILAGAMNIPLDIIIFYSTIISIGTVALITALGFYSGVLFSKIFYYFKYSVFVIGILVVIVIGLWFLSKYLFKKFSRNLEKI